MALLIDNTDYESADDTIVFWELPEPADHFYDIDTEEHEQLRLLCEDYIRIKEQVRELCRLMPAKRLTILQQEHVAVNEIERKIKKMLGRRVAYRPDQADLSATDGHK